MACSSYYKFRSEVKKQKGVDNPERFLQQGVGVNDVNNQPPLLTREGQGEVSGINNQFIPSPVLADTLSHQMDAVGEGNSLKPENPINQIIKLMSRTKKNFDISDVVSKLRNKKSRKDK